MKKQILSEDFKRMQHLAGIKILNENESDNLAKYQREVKLMTDPKIQQAWVNFYRGKIDADELKSIIKSICVGFTDGFYEYIDDMTDSHSQTSPSSSGSALYGFYDFDIQDSIDLSDEEFKPLYDLMNSTYRKIVRSV